MKKRNVVIGVVCVVVVSGCALFAAGKPMKKKSAMVCELECLIRERWQLLVHVAH